MSNEQHLSAYTECAGCGEEQPVMVTPDGYYCGGCVPVDGLGNVLRAIHRGY